MSIVRSAKIEAALEAAVTGGPVEPGAAAMSALLDQLERASGLPAARWMSTAVGRSPNRQRPNLDLARAVGGAVAAYGVRGEGLLRALAAAPGDYPKIVAAAAFASRRIAGVETKRSMKALQDLVEDSSYLVRGGVVEALRSTIEAMGDAIVPELAAWTDGYLQAHVALEALANSTILAGLHSGDAVIARLDEAFALADRSPRSAERLQGVRLLRDSLPAQIAIFAARFPETLDWLLAQAEAKRPETRDVVSSAIDSLRRSSLSNAAAARLDAALAKTAAPDRHAARVVHGTRKRSKGRRS